MLTLVALVVAPLSPVSAWADGSDDQTESSATSDTGNTNDDGSDADANSGDRPKQSLTIEQSTAVVTDTSGFHLKVMVANNSDKPMASGTLEVSTNALLTFISRADIQSWAEGTAPIPTPNEIGHVTVPAIPAGGTVTVNLDVASDRPALQVIETWGPKPLLMSYIVDGQILVNLTSFLTRSPDGLNTAQTPAMDLTVAMPLTSDNWQVNATAVNNLVTDNTGNSDSKQGTATSSGKAGAITNGKDEKGTTDSAGNTSGQLITLSEQDETAAQALNQALNRHRKLQVVADPVYLKASNINPDVAGVMQPADFDITTYSALDSGKSYAKAGVTDEQWSADQSQTLYASDEGENEQSAAKTSTYAWQGNAGWSMDALTKASEQGYSTVIADASFDSEQSDTVHTGTYVVNTDAGDVTVLKEQAELGELAQGQPTSKNANGEASDAGRLARLLAQSAFYQMEQPYTSRNLLMTFSRDSSAVWIDQVMGALEQASWLNLTDLETMAKAEPYSVSDTVNLDDSSKSQVSAARTALKQLAGSRGDIMRLAGAVLKHSVDSDDVSSMDISTLDPQALARQDAAATAASNGDPTSWVASLLAAHDSMALRALSGSQQTDTSQRMTVATRALADTLLGKVSITPSESVSVFSESAKMPVTVSNKLPYAVSVKVNSITDSMQIVTSRTTDIEIPANGEAQVSFTIRVSTSGSTVAHVSLADRNGQAFGNVQNTAITSVMRISDMSGFIIIGFAVLLGIVGLWRQFNRKKDPDE
ncbi:hypothetical protein DF196_00070 [Bifidobacterium callitrichidarum]|uniref:Secreted protein n=1 Tax=Bifidobacterium callitrichidarum TaxID=2052941 RepID=A0A2U2NDM6_9BIFI|nr:hypothetical protein DF196_00070 [Bifidobacterium callitrichidarum]